MKTIEQYEAEIESKSSEIDQQLRIFHENLPHLGIMLDRDPSVVYEVLVSQYNSVMDTFSQSTRRNTEILQGYVARLDKIGSVLDEVMYAIEELNKTEQETGLVPAEVADQVTATLDSAAEKVQGIIADETGYWIDAKLITSGLSFTAIYVLLRMLGVSKPLSAVGGGAAAYLIYSVKQA